MKILCIDTSSASCSVALAHNEKIFSEVENKPQAHSERLLQMCDDILTQAGIGRDELDLISVTRGPGSFTGIRIGISAAQGIAYALGIPVAPVSSLAALAQQCVTQHQARKVFCAQDARMGEIYYGAYELDGAIMKLNGEEGLCKPQDLPVSDYASYLACGSAWQEYDKELKQYGANFTSIKPDIPLLAEALIPFAREAFNSGNTLTPDKLEPIYLRNKVAKKIHERNQTQ